jgi:hypothetical protein
MTLTSPKVPPPTSISTIDSREMVDVSSVEFIENCLALASVADPA